VNALKVGLPWEDGVTITPLPEPSKPKYLQDLIEDAKEEGAAVVNAEAGGGTLSGALFTPAVVYPVTAKMRLFHEEQFGPVIPVGTFSDISQVREALASSWNGQQAAIFTTGAASAAPIVDTLASVVGRININSQCSRGPDVFPFSGRRSSAMGTMSVTEALRAFSIETLVAFPDKEVNRQVGEGLETQTKFLQALG